MKSIYIFLITLFSFHSYSGKDYYRFYIPFSISLNQKTILNIEDNGAFCGNGCYFTFEKVLEKSRNYFHYNGLYFSFILKNNHKNSINVNSYKTVNDNTIADNNSKDRSNQIINFNNDVIKETPKESKPVVTFITPPLNNHIVNNNQFKVSVKILNINSASQIKLKYNGLDYSNFSFDIQNHILEFNANLNIGRNTIQIIASNSSGFENKTTSVIYELPEPIGSLPKVTLLNPASTINATNNQVYNLKLSIENISVKHDINLLFNGVTQYNFTYNNNTHEIFYETNLLIGNNTFLVKASNQYGADSITINVNYIPSDDIKLLPIISFINPGNLSGSSQSKNYVFKATIANMINSNSIIVRYNEKNVTDFIFDGLNFSYTAIVKPGSNSLEISASNKDGTDSKTAKISFKPKIKSGAPLVSILNPNGSQTVNVTSYNFKFKALFVDKNQISITLNRNVIKSFNFDSNIGSFTDNLKKGINILSISGTNSIGTDTATENIYCILNTDKSSGFTPPTFNGKPNKKIKICHLPKGKNQKPQTISIPLSEWQIHKAHGDVMGSCNLKKASPNKTNPKTKFLNQTIKK